MTASGAARAPAGASCARPRDGEPAIATASATATAGVERTLALGWIAMLPLVVVYEIALAANPGSARNAAEYLIALPFEALLARPAVGRWTLEILATAASAWLLCVHVRDAELGLVRRVARIALEGFAAAVVLGPLLLVLLHAFDVAPPVLAAPAHVATPGDAALLLGGAAFEEIVFRVALLFAVGALARRTFEWFLGMSRTSRVLAEATALAGSAVLFAAAHLEPAVALVAPGGEPWDGARFAWRATAGLALAVLFRLRGVGVAAWCHAFFNLALALGAGPEVFL